MNLDIFLEIVKVSDFLDIKRLSETNKFYNNLFNENKEQIYIKLIKRDFPGRLNESYERKYKRLSEYSSGKQLGILSDWYMGKDQGTALLLRDTYKDINRLNNVFKTKPDFNISYDGNTPLMFAIEHSTPDVIHRILDNGANVNTSNNKGYTPLMFAIQHSMTIIDRLLDSGANVNTSNNRGGTPLMYAIEHSTPEIIHILLDNGANVNVENNAGNTPLTYAIEHSTPDIIHRLLEMVQM
jgi:curved DNA-binding protein CbpA